MEMEGEDLNAMFALIEHAQILAASEYAASLLAAQGRIQEFIDSQVSALNLTPIEASAVTQDERDGLMILSDMEFHRIIPILLEDLNSDNNLFLGFQNAASKKVFPRRSGRPKGSGKKTLKIENFETGDEILVSSVGENAQEPVEI